MPSSKASEKDGVQAGDLGSLLSSSLKISDKPGKALCDLPVEVLEKICRYLLGDQLIEFLSPTFRIERSRPHFVCHQIPIAQDVDAASERYEAVCLPLDSNAGAQFSPWNAASSSNRDLAVANNWAGTGLIPPHVNQKLTKDTCITKIHLGAMATCWKLRGPAVRIFWSTNTFSFECPIVFRNFIGYHGFEVLRQIRHLHILLHPIMTLARWWNGAFDLRGKSGLKAFPNLSTLHVTLTPRCDGKEEWATHTKVCIVPVLKFWKANLHHAHLVIGRARYQGWGDPEFTHYMDQSILRGLASGRSFLEDAQWQLSHGITAEKGQLRAAAFGDSVDWNPSNFPYEAPKFPFSLEIANMETDLPVATYDDEDSD